MARDIIHASVREALEKDNWIITDDPLRIELIEESKAFEIDLGAERLIAAERGSEKIAVEIKSFASPSFLYAFHEALGQYLNYRDAIQEKGMNREMVLAVTEEAFETMQLSGFIKRRLEQYGVNVLVVDVQQKTVKKWKR